MERFHLRPLLPISLLQSLPNLLLIRPTHPLPLRLLRRLLLHALLAPLLPLKLIPRSCVDEGAFLSGSLDLQKCPGHEVYDVDLFAGLAFDPVVDLVFDLGVFLLDAAAFDPRGLLPFADDTPFPRCFYHQFCRELLFE